MPSTLGIVSSNYTKSAPVSLLLRGNGTNGAQNNTFVDSSSPPKTITRNGSVTQGPLSPFPLNGATYNPTINGGSGLFRGASADYLTVNKGSQWLSRNADWTIECWFNTTANSGTWGGFQSACLASTNTGSSGFEWNVLVGSTGSSIGFAFKGSSSISAIYTFSLNTWYHTAVVKQGSKLIIFVDGIKLAEKASLSNWTDLNVLSIGRLSLSPYFYAFPGYISDFRITDAALYTSNFTVPTAPLTTTSNGGATPSTLPTSNQVSLLLNFTNGGVIDSVAKNSIATVGNAQISTAVKKYGTGSLAFDGSGDYLTVPATSVLAFGTEDFTIEFWCNFTSVSQSGTPVANARIYSHGLNASNRLQIYVDYNTTTGNSIGGLSLYTTSVIGQTVVAVNDGNWHHVAFVRRSGVVNTFVDGDLKSTIANSTDLNDSTTEHTIGAYGSRTGGYLNGYIDDFRIARGALYTTNFAPGPPSELPATDPINLNLL